MTEQDPLDGVEPPTQTQTESYIIAKEDIERNGLFIEAQLDSAVTGLMDHANFLLLLRLCVKTADARFGDMWMEILTEKQ